jgi:hypothetical protein
MKRRAKYPEWIEGMGSKILPAALLAGSLLMASLRFGKSEKPSAPNMFRPASTPAESIFHLSLFVLVITGVIFAV